MQEIDDRLYECFFGFVLRKFTERFDGCKRFNWKPETRRMKNKLFWQQNMQVFTHDNSFYRAEALLLKLVFSTYKAPKMVSQGFKAEELTEDFETID